MATIGIAGRTQERIYTCMFFTDDKDFLKLTQDKKPGDKNVYPFLEKNMVFNDIPKVGEVILISNNHDDKANLYQIETVYKHLYSILGNSREVEVIYRILMKQLYVDTRIVMVEKHKSPVSIPVRNNGRIYNGVDIRNYYYETDEDEYDVFEADDNLCNMPF